MKGVRKTDKCYSFEINGVTLENFRLESTWEQNFEKYVSDRGWIIVFNPAGGDMFADMFADIFGSSLGQERHFTILAASHDLLREVEGE